MEQEIKTIKKKKWYRRKLFYILIVVSLLIMSVVYGQYKKANKPTTYETVKVERGALTQTVDASGNIESADELDLRFDVGGRIGKIYKQTNDKVKVGDITVEIELGELNGRVAQASASVNKAKANLDKVLAGETKGCGGSFFKGLGNRSGLYPSPAGDPPDRAGTIKQRWGELIFLDWGLVKFNQLCINMAKGRFTLRIEIASSIRTGGSLNESSFEY